MGLFPCAATLTQETAMGYDKYGLMAVTEVGGVMCCCKECGAELVKMGLCLNFFVSVCRV